MIVQADIGSAQHVKSPRFLICGHQTENRTNVTNKNKSTAIFDNLDLRKNYDEIDGQRYPRDSLLINYDGKIYTEHYKDIKNCFKENVGEPILNRFISYPDMKTKYPTGIMGLRHQLDQIPHKNINNFKNMTLSLIMLDCFYCQLDETKQKI